MAGDIETNPGPGQRLKILQWNCQGLRSKAVELEKYCHDNDISVLALQEAQFPKGKEVTIRGFEPALITRRNIGRTGGNTRGGDVAIFVKQGLKYKKVMDKPLPPNDNTTEWVAVEMLLDKKPITIHNIYIPPIRSGATDQRLNNFDPTFLPDGDDTIIVGDVNAHHPIWDDSLEDPDALGEKFADWLENCNLVACNSGEPTFIHQATGNRSTPDLSLVSENIEAITDWSTSTDLGSDHIPILLEVGVSTHDRNSLRRVTRWAFKKADWSEYLRETEERFTQFNLKALDCPQKACREYTKIVYKTATKHIPRGCRKCPKPWWNEEVEETTKDRQRKTAHVDQENKDAWIEACQKAKSAISEAKSNSWKNYVETELSDRTDPSRLWNTIRKLDGRNNNAPKGTPLTTIVKGVQKVITTDRAKANAFIKEYAEVSSKKRDTNIDTPVKTEYSHYAKKKCSNCMGICNAGCCDSFSGEELEQAIKRLPKGKAEGPDHITGELIQHLGVKGRKATLKLINCSWQTNTFPSKWRRATIIPILKSGKPASDTASYRPISLTSHLAKLAERLVKNRLYWWLEKNNKIPPHQSGFRSSRSTEDHIGRLVQNTQDAWNDPKPAPRTVVTLFDFARAYDTVWRKGLALKMYRMGIPKCITDWVWHFIEDREASVRFNNATSSTRRFRQGLPQGSVLAPTLFTIWIADLQDCLPKNLDSYFFADDLLLASRHPVLQKAVENM